MTPAELLMSAPFDLQAGSISLHPASAKGMRVLDLAAAPGGKTTALAALMQGHGLLVANEIKDKRVGHLAVNVERWGAGNVVITNESPERLADHFGAFFDRVLVDAPCSGEGMFRKDMGARRDWSPEMVAGCAIRQRNILRVAAKLVRPGGYLLYSTCTFAPEEDEAVIDEFLTKQMGGDGSGQFEVVELPQLPGFMPGRPEWMEETNEDQETKNKNKRWAARRGAAVPPPGERGRPFHLPVETDGANGFQSGWGSRPAGKPIYGAEPVMAGVRRRSAAGSISRSRRLRVRAERLYFIPEELPDFGSLRVLHPGVWLGTFKKERFEPAHPLALFLQPGQAKQCAGSAFRRNGQTPYLPAGVFKRRNHSQRWRTRLDPGDRGRLAAGLGQARPGHPQEPLPARLADLFVIFHKKNRVP